MVIDPTALLGAEVTLDDTVEIGAFTTVGVEGDGAAPTIGRDVTIRSHCVVYRDVTLGDGCHLGHGVVVRAGTAVGSRSSIGTHSTVEHSVQIGDGVRLHSNCFVPELTILEDGAWLGPGVVVTNARYPNRPDTKANLAGVRVGRGAVVGAAVVLLPGIVIGAGALIGAGAVVVDDVEPGARVVGNPGRVLT